MTYIPGWSEEAAKRDRKVCHGPCDQGRKDCHVPLACRIPAERDDGIEGGVFLWPLVMICLIVAGSVGWLLWSSLP